MAIEATPVGRGLGEAGVGISWAVGEILEPKSLNKLYLLCH